MSDPLRCPTCGVETGAYPRREIQLRELIARSTGEDSDDLAAIDVAIAAACGHPIPETLFVTLGSARATIGMRRQSGGPGCDLRATQTERGVRLECLSCAVEVGPETTDAGDRISRHLCEVGRSVVRRSDER